MNITYEPNYKFNVGGDEYQVCKTFFGKLLDRVHHYTFFPYNGTEQVSSWYEICAFDCLDPKYQEKLDKLTEIVQNLETEITEGESIYFCLPENTSGEKLREIQEKLELALDKWVNIYKLIPMITTKPIEYDPCETSNFKHEFPFIVQGRDSEWRDSKYGGSSPYEACKLAKTLDICMSENTVLRVVKSKWNLKLNYSFLSFTANLICGGGDTSKMKLCNI